jgi:hypothetical protein
MSYSISTLLTRNLDDVFGENDPARRRAAIDEIYTEDCVFHEPRGVYHGLLRDATVASDTERSGFGEYLTTFRFLSLSPGHPRCTAIVVWLQSCGMLAPKI